VRCAQKHSLDFLSFFKNSLDFLDSFFFLESPFFSQNFLEKGNFLESGNAAKTPRYQNPQRRLCSAVLHVPKI
jgi:hypothetical protein